MSRIVVLPVHVGEMSGHITRKESGFEDGNLKVQQARSAAPSTAA
jgi:hypothetical protein